MDMMAWCPSISSMHHIVCMSWWQLFYRLWWNMVFFLNNLWQLCLFQFWKTRMVTLQANRAVALSTVASKILEIILVNHIEEYIVTKENQFAYKKGHSTDMCIFTLKECIGYYTVHNTPMYVCFLDASKVFDCINHWKLFKILVDRKYVIKALVYWYQNNVCASSGMVWLLIHFLYVMV